MGGALAAADLAPEPDVPDKPERIDAEHGRHLRGMPREVDPDERAQAYEAARGHADAEAAEQHDYQAEVPRFTRLWAEHEQRWPTPDRVGDVKADRSFRSDGGFYLAPDRNAEADAAISRIQEAEPEISADLRDMERDNSCGARLEGFAHRLKGPDRLKEKLAEALVSGSPDATPAEVLRQLPDAIRYTLCVGPTDYTRAYYEVKGRLESAGYEMYQSRNSWSSPEYKGVNTRWVSSDGVRFEVQFHTPDSFHAKQHVTHTCYERLRNPLTSRSEARELHAFQRQVSLAIEIPEGATELPDFKKEGL
jgi:hypothetical protein